MLIDRSGRFLSYASSEMDSVRDTLAQADQVVAACADVPAWALPDPELIAALDTVHGLRERLAAVEQSLGCELNARALPLTQGASSTPVWLREHWRIGIRAAKHTVELAHALAVQGVHVFRRSTAGVSFRQRTTLRR